jgi:hypothetical protein
MVRTTVEAGKAGDVCHDANKVPISLDGLRQCSSNLSIPSESPGNLAIAAAQSRRGQVGGHGQHLDMVGTLK